jgi:hypothetical protein
MLFIVCSSSHHVPSSHSAIPYTPQNYQSQAKLCGGSSQHPQTPPAKLCEIENKCVPKETECVQRTGIVSGGEGNESTAFQGFDAVVSGTFLPTTEWSESFRETGT